MFGLFEIISIMVTTKICLKNVSRANKLPYLAPLFRSLALSREHARQPFEAADVELAAGLVADGPPDVVPAVDADAELLEELGDGNLQGDGVAVHGLDR